MAEENDTVRNPEASSRNPSLYADGDEVNNLNDVTYVADHGPGHSESNGKPKITCYASYVLLLLLLAYLLNQLDRYLISIVNKDVAQDLEYGNQQCYVNSSLPLGVTAGASCNGSTENICNSITNNNSIPVCEWDYNGQGFQYELLIGPIYVVVYTFCGIPLGFIADWYNRVILLSVCCLLWSVFTGLTGAVQEYWELALLRFLVGAAEAGCTPFAASIIADYFVPEVRGLALGVYNWGIYWGYSMAFAFGNAISAADILGQGWRWSFYIAAIPGVLLAFIIFFTVKEPERQVKRNEEGQPSTIDALTGGAELTRCEKIKAVIKPFIKPSFIMLCLAGSVRNAAGYVWSYNAQLYYESIGQSGAEISKWMSWVPIVGGSLGVVFGGFVSDRVVKKRGVYARLIVIVISQLMATPFAVGVLLAKPPLCYISLIFAYLFGETWVGVTMVVVLELVPPALRSAAVAVYLFIITNIGGNMPLLIPVLQHIFEGKGANMTQSLRASLLILYPGEYAMSAILFLLTIPILRYDLNKLQQDQEYTPLLKEGEGSQKSYETNGKEHES